MLGQQQSKHTKDDRLCKTTIEKQVEPASTGIQANTYICLEPVTDEVSVDSSTPNYDTIMQECNRIPTDNKLTAVVCVMFANNKSFTSTRFSANND